MLCPPPRVSTLTTALSLPHSPGQLQMFSRSQPKCPIFAEATKPSMLTPGSFGSRGTVMALGVGGSKMKEAPKPASGSRLPHSLMCDLKQVPSPETQFPPLENRGNVIGLIRGLI